MTNKYVDHLLVLPEDDANRRLVNGFLLNIGVRYRRIQVLPEAHGWEYVMAALQDPAVINGLIAYPKRHLLLLIDFDDKVTVRLAGYADAVASLPVAIRDRVYLLGSLKTPERMRATCGLQLEDIGKHLASECPPPPAGSLWSHAHMQQNAPELLRLVTQVQPFLFQA